MKITRIDITHHRLDYAPPFRPSWDSAPRTRFEISVVRIHSDAGLVGVAASDMRLDLMGAEALFLGQDPLALERHHRVLANLNFFYGRPWPVDLALWDLAGKATGQPCWKLLGGLRDRVRAYASSGTLRAPAELADAAEAYLARGFKALKLRFHCGDWRDDVKALEAVRTRVGTKLELMVDCNQGWRMPQDSYAPWSLKDAIAVARELERLGVYWMEEPLHRADRAGMKALRQMTSVRIAGGEMNRELHEFRDLIADRCLDVLQPDANLVGGLTGLRRVAIMAAEHNLAFTPHTWGPGTGVVANAHLACGLADAAFLEFPYDPPGWGLERRDFMLAEPFDVDVDGWLVLTDAPGMGYELNEGLLEKTRVG